eukprot:TRINITY_DN47041_c0_g1_i1.p1 TRINITY_DN47041_c0_g1~~TRINITY_DN47041_c0_g1_i1.p1  ORF type:complete len:250 (+),score=19.93 TRINITY_DN47041_c0_g1_i1:90-839(+)
MEVGTASPASASVLRPIAGPEQSGSALRRARGPSCRRPEGVHVDLQVNRDQPEGPCSTPAPQTLSTPSDSEFAFSPSRSSLRGVLRKTSTIGSMRRGSGGVAFDSPSSRATSAARVTFAGLDDDEHARCRVLRSPRLDATNALLPTVYGNLSPTSSLGSADFSASAGLGLTASAFKERFCATLSMMHAQIAAEGARSSAHAATGQLDQDEAPLRSQPADRAAEEPPQVNRRLSGHESALHYMRQMSALR